MVWGCRVDGYRVLHGLGLKFEGLGVECRVFCDSGGLSLSSVSHLVLNPKP